MKKQYLRILALIILSYTTAIFPTDFTNYKNTQNSSELRFLKLNQQSTQTETIYAWTIDGNAELEAFCIAGTGTCVDPFIIENLTITYFGLLLIQNTNSHLKIQNCSAYSTKISTTVSGIRLINCSNVKLVNNTCIGFDFYGIDITLSNQIQIQNNNCSSNEYAGLHLDRSEYILVENNILDGGGIAVYQINNCSIDRNNDANGKSIAYFEDETKITLSGDNNIGQVICINCSKIVISSLNLCYVHTGILLELSNDNTICNNNCSFNRRCGIKIDRSSNNVIRDNKCNSNTYNDGITVYNSSKNLIRRNICNGNWFGINVYYSNKNRMHSNTVSQNYYGILSISSNKSRVFFNMMHRNQIGYKLRLSESNRIRFNSISENSQYGMELEYCQLNTITYNIFKDNPEEIYGDKSNNIIQSNSLTRIIVDWGIIFLISSAILGIIIWKKLRENHIQR